MLSLYKNNNKYNKLNLIFIIKKDSSRKNKNFFSIKAFAGKLVQKYAKLHASVVQNLQTQTAMKLQQLRYALEVFRHNLNVSEAADALFTSQPGISKQIRLLEEELGVQIFIRSGKRVVSVSQPGKAVLELSERILRDVQNIKNIGSEFTDHDSGFR